MAQEEKQVSKRRKTLERELEWIHMAPKARQAKGKARLNSYEKLLNEDQKERESQLEIFIPNGPRLGNKVIEAVHGIRYAHCWPLSPSASRYKERHRSPPVHRVSSTVR